MLNLIAFLLSLSLIGITTGCSLGIDLKGRYELPSLGAPGGGSGSAFITKWKTDVAPNSGYDLGLTDKQIQLPLDPAGTYDFTVDWGDGSTDHIQSWNAAEKIHTYAAVGEYTVSSEGTFSQFRTADLFGPTVYAEGQKIIDVVQWDSNQWRTMEGMFAMATTITGFSATDTPDLSQCTSLKLAFAYAIAFDSPINWDTSHVTDMSWMFMSTYSFNQVINFNTANVTDMSHMFRSTYVMNSAIHLSDTSHVTNMAGMFAGATIFDQPVNFNTSNVTDMSAMFLSASAFSQTLTFDTTNVLSCASFSAPLTFVQCTP